MRSTLLIAQISARAPERHLFERKTVCHDYVLDLGDGLIYLSSHTHKRGKHFTVSLKGGEQIYESFSYDEPADKLFSPHLVFNSPDPADRTLEYCSTYNNGVNADGSLNPDTVTRASRRPENADPCEPIACVAGQLGAACSGRRWRCDLRFCARGGRRFMRCLRHYVWLN